VVDDFPAWRRYVLQKLRENRNVEIIGVVSDGLEAVLKSEELRPDLILLDIGIPRLDGVKAAQRIRKVAPNSKILFLSQELDPDMARAALAAGGDGYLVKSDAESELFVAVQAIMSGKRFVSRRLAGHTLAAAGDSKIAGPFGQEELLGSLRTPPSVGRETTHCHEVQFYADGPSFLAGSSRFISAALKAGNPAIVIGTKSHRDSLVERLEADGVDVSGAILRGSYVARDAEEILATCMVNDMPDPARFFVVVIALLGAAARAAEAVRPRVAICGECAPLLWAEGKPDAAIRVEELWDKIARTYTVDILCEYSLESFRCDEGGHIFRQICERHSRIHSG
jgi:DNA-binding NarL/FixJ family response regulator